jgi:hypothetical protein
MGLSVTCSQVEEEALHLARAGDVEMEESCG